ncbi:hypothetical protein PF005_g5914 [Phytophthora fragariae]|uniref:Uncharacterized protein n=1 Tax=Phytophthora fragariae TaxID=53985 RepID=A0A6A3YUH9_9STRA|nr:hypothetical protein PF007_g6024 [Phytophthora fragariae]KAE9224443.1 hypothetical protein PF005_g5914 [Phytophthora fragariae]KAE9242931.1 hypothetical protein PF004_g6400 [Phytophthora fragariae]
MSTKFLLLYSDGSSEGVPIDEIEDYVPLLRQLPKKERELKKRKTENRSEERTKRQESSRTSAKRVKVQKRTSNPEAQSPIARPDVSAVASCFVKDMLWALTTTYNVGDAKQQALLATLDNRSEQPRAALARYIEEGGLDAMHQTLCNWACGAGDQNEDSNNDVKAEPPPTAGNPVSRHVAAEKNPQNIPMWLISLATPRKAKKMILRRLADDCTLVVTRWSRTASTKVLMHFGCR